MVVFYFSYPFYIFFHRYLGNICPFSDQPLLFIHFTLCLHEYGVVGVLFRGYLIISVFVTWVSFGHWARLSSILLQVD